MTKRGKLVQCKPKFNPFTKSLMMNTGGFPDFITFRKQDNGYEVIGVEVKANGWLDREEKEKCIWLLENKIFSRILIKIGHCLIYYGKLKGKFTKILKIGFTFIVVVILLQWVSPLLRLESI